MKIKTRDFGEVEINPNEIIVFDEGLPGIENASRFVVLSGADVDAPIFFMQSLDDEALAFVLVDMSAILPEYIEAVQAQEKTEATIYNIATIHADLAASTVNLKAPLIIDFAGKSGRQIVCTSDEFPVRANLFEQEEGGGTSC